MAWIAPAVTGLLLTTLYVPWFMNRATTARWLAASICIPILVALAPRFLRVDRLAALTGGAFLCWALASTAWAISTPDAIGRNWELLLGAGAFLWGASLTAPVWGVFALSMAVGMGVNSALAGFEYFDLFDGLARVTSAPSGTFLNGNYMAESAVVVLALYFGFKSPASRIIIPVLCLPAALLGGSRGAGVAIVALVAMAVARRWGWRYAALLGGALVAAAATYVVIFIDDPYSLAPRLAMWVNTAAGWTWFGYGSGSYLTGYALIRDAGMPSPPSVFGFLIRPQTAHNDALTLLFEYGVIGQWLVAAFVARIVVIGRKSDALYVVVAVLVLGLTNFPLYNPLPFLVFCAVCGKISGAPYISRLDSATPR